MLVWVTGGTSGIGAALVREATHSARRVINISRRADQEAETLQMDLSEPREWQRLREHLVDELAASGSEPVVFVHHAVAFAGVGFAGTVDPQGHDRHVL